MEGKLMDREDFEKNSAIQLLNSERGSYILSQALYIASEELKKVTPAVMQEKSNIADMVLLMDNLYPIFKVVQIAIDKGKKRDERKGQT